MSWRRLFFILILMLDLASVGTVLARGDGAGKPVRTETSRIRQLIHIVQSETDEERRRAAILELGRADPRHATDVIHAVTQALLKDASASVRLTAVEVIVGYRTVFPFSGLALEAAAESDASPIVRKAAQQAVWEYHLMGYKSARGGDRLLAQTPEPPLARPTQAPVPVTMEPPVRPAVAQLPLPAINHLAALSQPPGPRIIPQPLGPVEMLAQQGPYTATIEPPRAPVPDNMPMTVPSPATSEPPIMTAYPEPVVCVGGTPPLGLGLPPIVLDPGVIPGVTPFPEPTPEPPVRRVLRLTELPDLKK